MSRLIPVAARSGANGWLAGWSGLFGDSWMGERAAGLKPRFHTGASGASRQFPDERGYSTVSATQRETAVTILRGVTRTDSAASQLRHPENTKVLPLIIPR